MLTSPVGASVRISGFADRIYFKRIFEYVRICMCVFCDHQMSEVSDNDLLDEGRRRSSLMLTPTVTSTGGASVAESSASGASAV